MAKKVDLNKKFKCPYCYEEHRVSDCILICKKGECTKKTSCCYTADEAANAAKADAKAANDDTSKAQTIMAGKIKEPNFEYCLNKCKDSAVEIRCPKVEVMNEFEKYKKKIFQGSGDFALDIPDEFMDGSKTLTVAILGGVESGKTSYLTVLVNEMVKKFSNDLGCSVSALNEATRQIYGTKYYKEVYMDHVANEKTDAKDKIPPLLYSLEFPARSFSNRRLNLAFYDASGEDLRRTNTMIKDKGYVANADLVIVLLDPVQMPGVRERIQSVNKSSTTPEFSTAIIERLVEVIKSVKKPLGKIKVPVAVCIPKMDLLKDAGFFTNGDVAIFSESEHIKNKAFTVSEFNSTQNTMNALFAKFSGGNPAAKLKVHFKHYALFGFSALGQTPDGSSLDREIHPYRVLDPIIWALYTYGYIDKKKEDKI